MIHICHLNLTNPHFARFLGILVDFCVTDPVLISLPLSSTGLPTHKIKKMIFFNINELQLIIMPKNIFHEIFIISGGITMSIEVQKRQQKEDKREEKLLFYFRDNSDVINYIDILPDKTYRGVGRLQYTSLLPLPFVRTLKLTGNLDTHNVRPVR